MKVIQMKLYNIIHLLECSNTNSPTTTTTTVSYSPIKTQLLFFRYYKKSCFKNWALRNQYQ